MALTRMLSTGRPSNSSPASTAVEPKAGPGHRARLNRHRCVHRRAFTILGFTMLSCVPSTWVPVARAQAVVNVEDASPRVDLFEFRRTAAPGIAIGSGFYVARNRQQGESARARWTKRLPLLGRQELRVLAYIPGAERPEERTAQARYQVFHADGVATVTVSQRKPRSEWVTLGVFPFKAGDAMVILTDATGETTGEKLVVANAIRWVNG
jgi:hypothetical protein